MTLVRRSLILASCALLSACMASTDIVSTYDPRASLEPLAAAAKAGVPGAAAQHARYLELKGDYEGALDAWIAAPPSAWRARRVARLVDRVAVTPAQLAALVGSDPTVADPAALAASTAGDPVAFDLTRRDTTARAARRDTPAELAGPAAAIENALVDGDLRRARHHAEGLETPSPIETAALLALDEALVVAEGTSGDEAARIDVLKAKEISSLLPGIQLAFARLLTALGRLDEARAVLDWALGRADLGPGARREAQLEALRVADMMDDLGTFSRVAADLRRQLSAPQSAIPCAQRGGALAYLSPEAGLGRRAALTLDDLEGLAGPSLPTPGPCGDLHLKIAKGLITGSAPDLADALLDPLITAQDKPHTAPAAALVARAQALKAQTALQRGDRDAAMVLLEEALGQMDDGAARARLDQLRALSTGGPYPAKSTSALLESAAMEGSSALEIPLLEPVAALRRALKAPLSEYFEVIHHERVDLVSADGRALSRSHWLICFHDADATQRYGEVPLSPGEEVVIARTWKVDRRTQPLRLTPIDADDLGPDPEIVTLTALEPGDCAELLTLTAHGATTRPATYRGPTFYFDDPRGPTHDAQWAVVALDATVDLKIELGPNPPRPAPSALVAGRRWALGPLPTFVSEEGDARPDERRVSGRARWNADDQGHLAALHTQLLEASAPTPSVRLLAHRAIRGLSPSQWPRALHRAVTDRVVDDGAGPLGADQAQSLSSGQGSRALILMAAARALGLPVSLWLARPLSDGDQELTASRPLPFDDFSWPLLVFDGDTQTPTILDPRAPSGLPAALVRGVDALALGGARPPALVRVPKTPTGRRVIRYHVELQPDLGTFHGTGRESLDGLFAESWRAFIQQIPVANRTLLMAHIARASFADATTDRHTLDGLMTHDTKLDWGFEFKGSLITLSPERFELRVGLASDDPLGATGGLALREHPLFFNQIADTDLELCVRWPATYQLSDAPVAAQIEAEGLSWGLTVETERGDCRLLITKTYRTEPRWVAASAFRAFRQVTALISQRDYIRVEISKVPPPVFGPRPFSEPLSP